MYLIYAYAVASPMTSTLQQEKEKVEESPIQQQQQQEKVVGEHWQLNGLSISIHMYVQYGSYCVKGI